MLFLVIFWSIIAGFLELLILASGYIWPAVIMYLIVTLLTFQLGRTSVGDE